MARYNMSEEVRQIAEITSREEKDVAEELGLEFVEESYYGDGWYASNRKKENRTKTRLAEVKKEQKKASFRAARNGDAAAYKAPFFTRDGDGWAVVARGVDFVTDLSGAVVVKVRRRDGSVATVEVIGTVDRSSDKVRMWPIP